MSSRGAFAVVLAAGLVSAALSFLYPLSLAAPLASTILLGGLLLMSVLTRRVSSDHAGRRRLLLGAGAAGLSMLVGGSYIGRLTRRLFRADSRPVLEGMARRLGSEYMAALLNGYHPERSPELMLVTTPYTNAISWADSLVPRDPRSNHTSLWMYLQRVPLVVYGPGIVPVLDSTERVSLADIAPTIARLLGFDEFLRLPLDGAPLPGIDPPTMRPRVVVVVVLDGGGWNVLQRWPGSWPNLRRMVQGGATYRNAVTGSFPTATAPTHATIGSGTYPRKHGITGHHLREGRDVVRPYGDEGHADPSDLLVPTLAELWREETAGSAWTGLLGYQLMHLGLLGAGADRSGETKPVAVYWETKPEARGWRCMNPELYRLPESVPPLEQLRRYQQEDTDPPRSDLFPPDVIGECCSPAAVRYVGALIEECFRSEPIGAGDVTDLVFINFKAPDYAGHIYNMLSDPVATVMAAVDRELGRLVSLLRERVGDGRYVVVVTADHGQTPMPEASGGVRLDLQELGRYVGRRIPIDLLTPIQLVTASEMFLDPLWLLDTGASPDELAASLVAYTYGDNVAPYVPADAILRDKLDRPLFAGAFTRAFLEDLAVGRLWHLGSTAYPEADPGVPDLEGDG